jgi:hypothetical protein
MKIIRIILFSLLALSLIVCAGIFIFFETFDTDQYLPQITKKASIALGRPVSITGVALGFSDQGITLDAGPVTIADDPGFTTQPFIKVDRVRISLDLGPLILRREIHITGVLLQSPRIHLIRSQEGNFNVSSIGQARWVRPKGEVLPALAGRRPFERRTNSVEIASLLKSPLRNDRNFTMLKELGLLRIQDASISFIDQNQAMPLDIWLSNINASLNDFSLSKSFRLSFDASPLVSKSISPQMPDIPIFKNIRGGVQFNRGHLDGDIIFTDGVIKNFNIIKTVLSHTLGVFGGMGGNIDKLGAQDIAIEKAEAKFSFHDKVFFIDDLLIKTNIFELTAQGPVDQGLNMDMQTMLHLNADVSAALVNEFEGLKYLMDDSKRIAIDASLKGAIPHLKYKPNKDFRKKSKKVLMEEGGDILGALLGGGQTSAQGQGASLQDSGKEFKNNFKNIFKNLLR